MSNLSPSISRNFTIKNNGHTVVVTATPDNAAPTFVSPFNGNGYRMVQTHYHWSHSNNGSEMRLNGVQYGLEVSI